MYLIGKQSVVKVIRLTLCVCDGPIHRPSKNEKPFHTDNIVRNTHKKKLSFSSLASLANNVAASAKAISYAREQQQQQQQQLQPRRKPPSYFNIASYSQMNEK